ncbi:MAG: LLM class flavin-dependent oxidoreductase [Dehalococcoidia bacterium]
MEISLIYELDTPDTTRDQTQVKQAYDECIEQVQLADQLGYKTVWFTEHHFLPGFSHSSAPEEFLAYLAAKTTTIRLGHAIVLLPFAINHPLRVAERVAVLDILSDGRVEIGGGRAISESELSAFGVDPEETRAQWEESLRMLPKMWMEEEFSWDSELIKIPPRSVTPRPVQRPHPPMSVAATQPATVEFAGKNGLGCLAFGIGTEQSNDLVELYRREIANADPIGGFVTNNFGLFLFTLCLEDEAEALAIQGPNFMLYQEQVKQLFAPWVDGKAPYSYSWFMEYWSKRQEEMKNVTMEQIVEGGGAAIGSVETCRKVFQHLADAGVDEVLCFMQIYTTPHDKILRSIELIANEVLPAITPAKA